MCTRGCVCVYEGVYMCVCVRECVCVCVCVAGCGVYVLIGTILNNTSACDRDR